MKLKDYLEKYGNVSVDEAFSITSCIRVQAQVTLLTTNYYWLEQYTKDNEEDIRKYVFGL